MSPAAPPLEKVIRLKVSADLTSVREAIATITEHLEQRFSTIEANEADTETAVMVCDTEHRELTADVELLLAEISNNIVEHGYQDNENAKFSVKLLMSRRLIVLRFIDFGRQLPPRLPHGHLSNFTVEKGSVPERGFGWQIIRVLAKDIHHRRKLRANVLEVSLNLSQS